MVLMLAMSPESADAAEWILLSAVRGASSTHEGVPTMWMWGETIFTDEAACLTAAQALSRAREVQTRCTLRVWRIYRMSAPKPISPGRTEVIPPYAVRSDKGEVETQRMEPTSGKFDTESECRAQLSQMLARSGLECVAETPNWRWR